METSGFFNAVENVGGSYDRVYVAEQFANFFSMFIGNGVFASPQNQLKVVAKENLTITIKKGFAFIDGYWYYNDSDIDIDITPNATATGRKDGVFIALNKTDRAINAVYELGRTDRIVNDSVHELKLAEINVDVGVATITDSKIIDTRPNNSVCGFVTGIIDVIETDDLFLQFTTQFNEWFEHVKEQLSEDAAGNLQNQIDEIVKSVDEHESDILSLFNKSEELVREDKVLQGQIDLIDIFLTSEATIHNTKHGGYRLTKMKANTVQNGTPSPATPFPLLSTGDCVELVQGYLNNGVITVSADAVSPKNIIPCKSGDSIKIALDTKLKIAVAFYGASGFISQSVVENVTERTVTSPSGATGFRFYIGTGASAITPQTVGKITITINGKYLGCAKTIPKNLINNALETTTKNGVTCTKNGDGTYTLNGTSTNSTDFIIGTISIPNGAYKLVGCPSGGGMNSYLVYIKGTNAERTYDEGNGAIIQYDNSGYGKEISIYVKSGTTLDNVVFKPMLTTDLSATYDDFVPYGGEPTVAYYLTEHKMMLGSTLFRENGLVKAIHTFKEIVADGTNPKVTSNIQGNNADEYLLKTMDKKNGITNMMSNMFTVVNSFGDTIGTVRGYANSPEIAFSINKGTNAIQWLADNLPTFQYELATPIIETLDTESQIALNGLETFDGVTCVEFDARVQPLEFEAEVGASKVSAMALENANLRNSLNVTCAKYEVANNLTTTVDGFVLDARQGKNLGDRTSALELSVSKRIIGYDEDKKVDISAYVGTGRSKWYTVPDDGLIVIELQSHSGYTSCITLASQLDPGDGTYRSTVLGNVTDNASFHVYKGQKIAAVDMLAAQNLSSISRYTYRPYMYGYN